MTRTACLAAALAAPAAAQVSVFTDFEEFNPNTVVGEPFAIGASPHGATFSGDGFAGLAGIGELYFSGVRAWMINPAGAGAVHFETPASEVSFWTRLRTGASGPSVYTAFDTHDAVIDTITIDTPGPFQQLTFTGEVARLEVLNQASGADHMNSIDDFAYTTVPSPAPALLPALVGLAGARRRS